MAEVVDDDDDVDEMMRRKLFSQRNLRRLRLSVSLSDGVVDGRWTAASTQGSDISRPNGGRAVGVIRAALDEDYPVDLDSLSLSRAAVD